MAIPQQKAGSRQLSGDAFGFVAGDFSNSGQWQASEGAKGINGFLWDTNLALSSWLVDVAENGTTCSKANSVVGLLLHLVYPRSNNRRSGQEDIERLPSCRTMVVSACMVAGIGFILPSVSARGLLSYHQGADFGSISGVFFGLKSCTPAS